MKTYPALVVRGVDADLVAALVDECSPTAIEPRDDDVRVFFTTAQERDAALSALAPGIDASAIDVSDEDWARRSQEDLRSVTVGNITIFPDRDSAIRNSAILDFSLSDPQSATRRSLFITPSMGFGTGHHATTRLCLEALQAIDVRGRTVLDVGTGSGILAIAAALLGAARATGIDSDADALQSARENFELNPGASTRVVFAHIDLTAAPLPSADIVVANLTGALLTRSAAPLSAAVRRDGLLILSGLLTPERDAVCAAFARMRVVWEREQDGWVGLVVKRS